MIKRSFISFIILALAFSCVKESAAPEMENTPDVQTVESPEPCFIPGEVIVQVDDSMLEVLEEAGNLQATKSADFNTLASQLQITSAERVFPDGGRFEARHRSAGLHRWYRIHYDAQLPSTKAAEGLSVLKSMKGILSLERPRKKEIKSFNYFNDPYAFYQWFLYNDGTLSSGFKSGSDINVVPVWEKYTAGSENVIVAVLDGGVDGTHSDLEAVFIPAGPDGSRNFAVSPKLGEYEIAPDNHGTHVAGIIGAVNNNKNGACGVAGGKDGNGGVRIMSCSLSSGQSETLDGNDPEAFVWAADHGAVIANNSWGYTFSSEDDARRSMDSFENGSSSLKSAIDYFIDNAGLDENGNQVGPMKGGVVLFSAGNEAYGYGVPAGYSRVVAVGSFQHDNSFSSFSQYGDWIDVWAPGGGSEKSEQMILSCIKDDNYAWMSGTSQACPNASGVAALLVSYYGGPGFTNEELVERLVWGAKFGVLNDRGRTSGGGRLDALGAFEYRQRTPVSFITDYSGNFSFKSHEKAQIKYTIAGNEDEVLKVEGRTNSPILELALSPREFTLSVDALKGEPGTYSALVTVGKGTKFQADHVIEVTILPNHEPQVANRFENQVLDAEQKESLTLNLKDYFIDDDAEPLTYVAEIGAGNIASASVSSGVLTIKALTYGQTGVTVTASDARGKGAKQSFTLLARDTSRNVDLYPNPVSDNLNVRPSADGTVSLTFYNQIGAKVLEADVPARLFEPGKLNVSGLPAGVYTVKAVFDGMESKTTIVKL